MVKFRLDPLSTNGISLENSNVAISNSSSSTSGGTTDHSALTNLTYADSGHTGFQPAGTYLIDISGQDLSTADNTTSAFITAGDIPTIPDSVDDLSPSQTGNNGKFLKTDGTNATWESIPGGGDMLASVYDPAAGAKQVAFSADLGSAALADTGDFATAAQGSLAGTALQSETDPVYSASEAASFVAGDAAKLAGIEPGAEVNNISDVNATDLTDSGATTLHKHSYNNLDDKPSIPTQYTDEMAQDAVGGMVDTTLTYTDGTPELKVTNPVTPAATGFTITAGTTPKTLTVADTASVTGTNTGDQTASDFDIKDLTDTTALMSTWSAKQDAFVVSITTDDDIQTALDACDTAGGGTVALANGIYEITTALTIPSHTKLLGIGDVTIKRMANTTAMLLNEADGATGGYLANTNICVENITFDCNDTTYTTPCTSIGIGHANNVLFDNCRMINTSTAWHQIEINGSKNVVIRRSTFTYDGSAEALQFDLMLNDIVFPWFGPYDSTTNENILVEDCSFYCSHATSKAIGNHSFEAGSVHNNITIRDCYFTGALYAINQQDVNYLTVDNCVFTDNNYGVYQTNQSNNVSGWNIINNKCDGNYKTEENRFFTSNFDGSLNSLENSNFNIIGNDIYNCSRHGISGTFTKNINILNNKIYGCGRNGIYLYGGDNVNIQGNNLHDNYLSSATWADIVVGNNATVSSDNIIVSGNIANKIILGTYTTKVLCQNNIAITSLTNNAGAEATLVDNLVAGIWGEKVGLKVHVGVIPGSTVGTTGKKSISGIGFKPKLVKFTVLPSSSTSNATTASGSMDENGNQFTTAVLLTGGSGYRNSSQSHCIGYITTGATWLLLASYSSMDSDGFSITVNTASSVFTVAYEAYG